MAVSLGKVPLTEEKATLLLTLYSRALQNRKPNPILSDPWSEDAIHRIDYDFSKFHIGTTQSLLVASRARQLDLWTARYLADHDQATVLHLGCGLDSRVFRINPPVSVEWFDIDYPEVIELRQHLYSTRTGYRMIGSSLADLHWLDGVPNDRPAFIVAEGVTMYLTEAILKRLLNRLVDHCPSGQIAFDVHSQRLVALAAKHGARFANTGARYFRWGLNDPETIKQLEPRLKLVADAKASQSAGYLRMPRTTRFLVRLMDAIPATRRMRCLLYMF
jgi:O-methyltransferase involved in polyketide biosynthesis